MSFGVHGGSGHAVVEFGAYELLGLCNEQCSRSLENISSCAKRTVSELNACMAVFGGSLVDEPLVSDFPKVVLPFLDDDIEPLAITRDEPDPHMIQ